MQLHHGGRLSQAAATYQIPECDWLDLSTGISPWSWPIPESMPQRAWQRLPDADQRLSEAACRYYQAPAALPVAGSQAAIRALPWVRKLLNGLGRVALPLSGYREHRLAWERAGFDLCFYRDLPSPELVAHCAVVVVIHPHNPLGCRYSAEELDRLHRQLQAQRGWLLVDEAFLDAEPCASLAAQTDQQGLIVLRSVGKFFGLAGLRAGFVLAEDEILQALGDELGPWTLNGPASWLLPQVLSDSGWQQSNRARLQRSSDRLSGLLHQHFCAAEAVVERAEPTHAVVAQPHTIAGTALFQTVLFEQRHLPQQLFEALARQGVLVRLLDERDGLRFGLPCDDAEFNRLDQALTAALTTLQTERG